ICNSNDDCQNDGVCLDKDGKNFCECNPGTEGDHCEIVVDCVTGRYRNCTGERGTCMFDQIIRTAVCICSEKKRCITKNTFAKIATAARKNALAISLMAEKYVCAVWVMMKIMDYAKVSEKH
ncbi:hypothetical protein CEXT_504061, partial [Caerostris extrusa]